MHTSTQRPLRSDIDQFKCNYLSLPVKKIRTKSCLLWKHRTRNDTEDYRQMIQGLKWLDKTRSTTNKHAMETLWNPNKRNGLTHKRWNLQQRIKEFRTTTMGKHNVNRTQSGGLRFSRIILVSEITVH